MRLRDFSRLLAVALLAASLPVGAAGALAPTHVLASSDGSGGDHPCIAQPRTAAVRAILRAQRVPLGAGGRDLTAALASAARARHAPARATVAQTLATHRQGRLLSCVQSSRGPPVG